MTAAFDPCAATVLFTGAGISAPSGLATYRGPGGIWTTSNLESHMTAAGAALNLAGLWEHWGEWRAQVAAVTPNAAHVAIADAQAAARAAGGTVTVITQNIDGLHTRAGATDVIELHGNVNRSRCTLGRRPGKHCVHPAFDDPEARTTPGVCPGCGRASRPDIVLFGEHLNAHDVSRAEAAARSADLFVAVGTSGNVWPAVELVDVARTATRVLINLDPWPADAPGSFDELRLGDAATLVPELLTEHPTRH